MNKNNTIIIGAGITGLAAGYASGFSIYESTSNPGGICNSYYIRPFETQTLLEPPSDNEAYRFEIGGGHWVFGVDSKLLKFITKYSDWENYQRRSSIYDYNTNSYIPFPIQNHLKYLGNDLAAKIILEILNSKKASTTMKEWLLTAFGKTLCELFFFPFNELYTAALYDRISPQDLYKSPVDIKSVIYGALSEAPPTGYNTTFYYPKNGLNTFIKNLSQKCDIKFKKKLKNIDIKNKIAYFSDNSEIKYNSILSTIPLNKMIELSDIHVEEKESPHTSVLVLNIGAKKGPLCPKDHWLYIPYSKSGFHRIGFYSNVDVSFLPSSSRRTKKNVSIYVERAFRSGTKIDDIELEKYKLSVLRELSEWGFVDGIEVVDYSWVSVAYTWALPQSKWRKKALKGLEQHDIYQLGRYGNWKFQGIAESIKNGLFTGSLLR